MEWQFIVALAVAAPIGIVPVIFFYYLKTCRSGAGIKESKSSFCQGECDIWYRRTIGQGKVVAQAAKKIVIAEVV